MSKINDEYVKQSVDCGDLGNTGTKYNFTENKVLTRFFYFAILCILHIVTCYMKQGAHLAQGSHFSHGSHWSHLGSSGLSMQGRHGTHCLHSPHLESHSLQKHFTQSSHLTQPSQR